jgi:hypothetical protein
VELAVYGEHDRPYPRSRKLPMTTYVPENMIDVRLCLGRSDDVSRIADRVPVNPVSRSASAVHDPHRRRSAETAGLACTAPPHHRAIPLG